MLNIDIDYVSGKINTMTVAWLESTVKSEILILLVLPTSEVTATGS